jgi:hypothetical protein
MSKLDAIVNDLVINSRMRISFNADWTGALKNMVIRLDGAAARIPSLKNAKLPGKNFINPDVTARLRALDALYAGVIGHKRPSFGKQLVWMTLILGARKSSYDSDNCYAAVCDWLEPHSKIVGGKARGWGAGIVPNDKLICGLHIPADYLGLVGTHTTILLERLEDVRVPLGAFLETMKTSHRVTNEQTMQQMREGNQS